MNTLKNTEGVSKAWKFSDDVDTEQIIPGPYLTTFERESLAPHCMEDADPTFSRRVSPGDIIVGGRNFGCGSSREHAPLAILGVGVKAVIAASFARIFFRNCVNLGLPIFECPGAAESIVDGDHIQVSFETGRIDNLTQGQHYQATPLPEFARSIMEAGGLMQQVRRRLADPNTQQSMTE